jgi:aminoglycoside phosphotransferase (APT) family kinase protein
MLGKAAEGEEATMTVRPGMEIDPVRLDAYLAEHVADYRGPLMIRQFKGGQSNPTYLLKTPERSYVLRRKPPGPLLASAHAVEREFRVVSALSEHTSLPVARTYVLCTDNEVVGTWFYVMERIEGRIFWDPAFPELRRDERAEYFDAMNSVLAMLHMVDPAEVGLGDFGKPAGYLVRQIRRWSDQYRADKVAGRVLAMERLIEWLPQNIPESQQRPAVVHGDFRSDNLIFHPAEPRVLAILDWELSTIGDPLADFAYHLLMYRMPTLAFPGLLRLDLPALNIPTEAQYVASYCARTKRDGIPNLNFYLTFCMFRLAGIFHGIRGRIERGTAVSAHARRYASHVEEVAELAWQQVSGAA